MNLNNLKIKYILGSYKNEPSFPTIEDFEFLYTQYIKNPNNEEEIKERRLLVNDTNGADYVTNKFIVYDICVGDKKIANRLLDNLLKSGNIEQCVNNKSTYKILKMDY